MPQENGNRSQVRWAELTGGGGRGLRVEGRPHVELTARRWTSEDLDAARHASDLVARDRVWLNVDLAQHGLGSGACGPAVLPQHRLEARPRVVRVRAAPARPLIAALRLGAHPLARVELDGVQCPREREVRDLLPARDAREVRAGPGTP